MNNTRLVLGIGALIIALLLVGFVAYLRQGPAEKHEESVKGRGEPFFKPMVERQIRNLYDQGLKFSNMNYVQWDPMGIQLWHCKNSFKGRLNKKSYEYLARLSYDDETGVATLYYLKINDEVIIWDEELEDEFLDNN